MKLKSLFPCSLTVGNLLCGFLAIAVTLEYRYVEAAWLILLGALFDGIDGFVARTIGGNTTFGREFDSLADLVTFGVASAVLVYNLAVRMLGALAWVVCGIYLIAGAFRLVRFNITAGDRNRAGYAGLPITSAGICLASFTMFSLTYLRQTPAVLSAWLMIVLAVLMASTVRYSKVPLMNWLPELWQRIVVGIGVLIPVLVWPNVALLIAIGLYILGGLVAYGVRLIARQATEREIRSGML